jgi:thioredoxin-dependent peroxiredoxin
MSDCSIVWHPAKFKLLFACPCGRWFFEDEILLSPYPGHARFAQRQNTLWLVAALSPDSQDAPLKATKGRRMSQKTRKNSKGDAPRLSAAQNSAGKARKTGDSTASKSSTRTAKTASVLQEGMRAPSFSLPRDGGQSVALNDFAGRKLVIFFYPRADTPGCTMEAANFSQLASDFASSETAVLGVSADPVKAQERFRDKHQLTVPLISDEEHEMLNAYGVWGEKSMYGKVFEGILRTTVLIDREGKIARIWPKVRVPGHAEEVLAAARSL